MKRFIRPILTLAASLIAAASQPAAADDGRRHVMTPLQKIDLVRDLPDIPAFERDGQYFDLGYIYPIHTVNGASVATTGGEAGYVLYHDDKYLRADATIMADLRYVLGDDPTQGYTPPTPASATRTSAAADPWSADGNTGGDRGEPIAAPPARGRRSSGMGWIAFVFAIVLLSAIRWGRNMLIRGVFDLASHGNRRSSSPYSDYPHDTMVNEPFDSRVAARLAELHSDVAPTQRVRESAAPLTPTTRGFGRKGV